MKIRAFSNSSGSSWWRLESVSNYITTRTDHEMMVFNAKDWRGDILEGDIVVFQMVANPQAIIDAKAQGAKVVYEIDDLITEKTNRVEADGPDSIIKGVKESIKLADLVTTTTEELAKRMRKFNKNVVVLPNYIDPIWWKKPLEIKHTGKIRLGWAGSTSHLSDLEFIAPVVKRVLDDFDNVQFIYCGAGGASSNDEATQLMYGKDLFSSIPSYRKEYHLGINTELWGIKSKTLHFDIAIAPLIKDKFNDCKSNIKWQEYSLNGWAGVYSDVPAYKDIGASLKAEDEEDFYMNIKYLITHPEERLKIANKAYGEVLNNWTLDKHYEDWVKVYLKCLNQ